MNKWRLLLFSVFGLLQITTSDRNFINGRYSCCDHSQRYSESDTRIITYEPYRVHRDLPDLQQRKLSDSPTPVREQEVKSTRNIRYRERLSSSPSDEERAFNRRLSRERNVEYNQSERDESQRDRFARNHDKLTLPSRFMDTSRYSYKFNNEDRVNRENENMRQYDIINYLSVQRDVDNARRNNERLVRDRKSSEESAARFRRSVYIPENRLHRLSRNTDTIRREDQRLTRKNTQTRNSGVLEENIRFVRESSQIEEDQVNNNRRVISKRNLDSSRHSMSVDLRRDRNENRQRRSVLDVSRQEFPQLRATNTVARHIKYSRELNQIYEADNLRSISRDLRNIRITETRERGRFIEQDDRRERSINIIRSVSSNREISDIRRQRNELRERRAQDNFDYRQNRDSFQTTNIRDNPRNRRLTDVRYERIITLREEQRRDNNNDRDRSRDLLSLDTYRYRQSGESRNNRHIIRENNCQDQLNTRPEHLIQPVVTDIRRERNIIRENVNRQGRFTINREVVSTTNNRNERNSREVTDVRQEREALREEVRVNRNNIRRDQARPSRLDVHIRIMDQRGADIIREEHAIREENIRQTRSTIRQLARDVSRINIRTEQRYRELDDARRERRVVREEHRQYILNIRQGWSSRLRTISTLRRLDVQRGINIINEQSETRLENAEEKRDLKRQERDTSRRHNNDERQLQINSRNMQEITVRQRMYEISVRGNVLNVIRDSRDNLAQLDRNTQGIRTRQNIRSILRKDDSESRRANILNINDRLNDRRSVRQEGRDTFRILSRNIRDVYDVKENNKISERTQRRESQRVDYNLSFRRDDRDNFPSRDAQTPKIYRMREDNERLLRTVHERLSMRTYQDEPKRMAAEREELHRTRSQSITDNGETKDSLERNLNSRTTRGERLRRNDDDRAVRRDTRRIAAITENRFRTSEKNIRSVPLTYKPDTDIFEMKWQYLFYTLQAIYLLSLFMKIPKNEEGKSKLRIITWLAPMKTLKME